MRMILIFVFLYVGLTLIWRVPPFVGATASRKEEARYCRAFFNAEAALSPCSA
jgi:hypothetical protein